ncbi:DNA-binding protein [Uliginosibacterium sediminicola]|uniref:DNA-binding protein n=1 Tax=Uliginosibacterium sediminicola TaxID=2024550 RepID=UPI003D0C9F9C
MVFSISRNGEFARLARRAFEESGIPVAEWARAQGFSANLVYQVLEGKRKCLRGQSHRIAVALGLKDGAVLSLEQLCVRLHDRAQWTNHKGSEM